LGVCSTSLGKRVDAEALPANGAGRPTQLVGGNPIPELTHRVKASKFSRGFKPCRRLGNLTASLRSWIIPLAGKVRHWRCRHLRQGLLNFGIRSGVGLWPGSVSARRNCGGFRFPDLDGPNFCRLVDLLAEVVAWPVGAKRTLTAPGLTANLRFRDDFVALGFPGEISWLQRPFVDPESIRQHERWIRFGFAARSICGGKAGVAPTPGLQAVRAKAIW